MDRKLLRHVLILGGAIMGGVLAPHTYFSEVTLR